MQLDHDATPGKYIEYCIATQASWKICAIDKQERYAQIFEAVRTNKRIKKLLLRCELHGGPTDYDLYKFASALEANTSLETLVLRGLNTNVPHGFAAVLQALTQHTPKLTAFECTSRPEFVPAEWTALIEFLRSNTTLKTLDLFNCHLTEEQLIELMDVLKHNSEVKFLDLEGSDLSFASLMAIAQFVASSTTLEELRISELDLTKDEEAQLIAIMQNNTSLVFVPRNVEFLNTSQFVERNLKAWHAAEKQRRKFEFPEKPQPWQPVLLPDTTHEPAIKQLSSDILRLILWQLDVRSLCAFRRTDRQHYAFTKNNIFWRDYYTKYFSCVPGDVFLLTDLTYGIKLANARTPVEAFATPLWEEMLINSFRARTVSAKDYPTNYCIPFMEPVYRQFPQLIGATDSSGEFTALPPSSDWHKKGLPYAYTWFLIYAKGSAVYHLGFEKLHDGQYNGILFFTQDFSAAFSARFDYMLYIFEWFTTYSETEFAEKCKDLCQLYLCTRETNNYDRTTAPFYKDVEKTLLQPALKARDKLITSLNSMIDSAAKEYCSTNNTVNMTLVEDLIKQFKRVSDLPDLDLERVRQYIPKRSSLNAKYVTDDNVTCHNFTTHDWEIPEQANRIQYKAPRHRKKAKKLPQVVLAKLYRVALNFILMPVLKTFWLDDINNPDYEIYPFLRWSKESFDTFKELYYSSSSYVPFEHISIGKACPAQWPMIALGLANQIMPYIIAAMNGIMQGTTTDLDKLVVVLDQTFIPQRIKFHLRKIAEGK